MALKVPNVGELEMLDKLLRDSLSSNENYILKLYKNDYTPDDNATAGSFTEATFTNYAARTLTRGAWYAAAPNGGGKAESSYSTVQSWTCGTTGNTVYGYWVVGSVSTTCLWAERFSTSRVLANGDVLNITPKFSLSSEY